MFMLLKCNFEPILLIINFILADGIWNLTMSRIRAWFKTYSVPMNIVIGVVLDANRDGTRDPDSDYANKFMGVAIPTHFYVVITRCGVSSKSLQSCGVEDLKVLGLVLQHPKQPGVSYCKGWEGEVLRHILTLLTTHPHSFDDTLPTSGFSLHITDF